MKRTWNLLSGLICAVLCLMPQIAFASIQDVLGEIRWGDTKEEVVEKLRSRRIDALRENSRLRNDRVAMQRERQLVLDDMRRVEDSFTELRGSRTGYEVSVVAREFHPNNDESLMRIRDEVAQRYFFFHDGKLYKLVVAYDQSYVLDLPFESFLSQVTRRYGRPTASETDERQGEEVIVKAIWRDGRTELRVEDQTEFYGTFTMAFSNLETESGLAALREDRRSDQAVSARVRSLRDMSATDPNAGVIEDMIGQVNVSLPERPNREEEAEGHEEGSDRPEATTEASPRQDRPARSRPARQGDPERADGDDLVIY